VASVTILTESCKGVEDCGLCMDACPKNLFTAATDANSRGYIFSAITDEAACIGCAACMHTCPDFAIVVTKTKKSKEAANG